MASRLLGHLLRLAPYEHGQDQLGKEINDAKDEIELISLAENYAITFIRTCEINPDHVLTRAQRFCLCSVSVRRVKGPTTPPSEHPSRPSVEDEREYRTLRTEESSLDHRKAKKWVSLQAI